VGSVLTRWWTQVQVEAQDVWALLTPPAPPEPGLYTYPISLEGGQRRVHLRIEQSGAGVLFIDVTDVIHLNATAAFMAKLALDEVSQETARRQLQRYYRGVDAEQLAAELVEIYELVQRFRSTEHCPTCAVHSLVDFRPVFSTPVDAPFKADVAPVTTPARTAITSLSASLCPRSRARNGSRSSTASPASACPT
jgi:hypothetical protein